MNKRKTTGKQLNIDQMSITRQKRLLKKDKAIPGKVFKLYSTYVNYNVDCVNSDDGSKRMK